MMNTILRIKPNDKKTKATLKLIVDGDYWEVLSMHSSIELYLRDRDADKGGYPWNSNGMVQTQSR